MPYVKAEVLLLSERNYPEVKVAVPASVMGHFDTVLAKVQQASPAVSVQDLMVAAIYHGLRYLAAEAGPTTAAPIYQRPPIK